MSKDKKKKGKKDGKSKDKLKALAQNPLVADVVAAALVATAAALKDSKRARALASAAADELTALSKSTSNTGSAMWELALQVGRQSLQSLFTESASEDEPAGSKKAKLKVKAGKSKSEGEKRPRKTKTSD
ncbi:hypothetical protein [Sphingomonas flavescens]|uniref:hypothetical protein n=1 Tax=Sphingomonas flavescens TaxID=3132797 RepID=UPI002805E206|nr:hypothetical protein [Sphingomonas limnosediminicola]